MWKYRLSDLRAEDLGTSLYEASNTQTTRNMSHFDANCKQFQDKIFETNPHMLGFHVTEQLDWINCKIENTAHASIAKEDTPQPNRQSKL